MTLRLKDPESNELGFFKEAIITGYQLVVLRRLEQASNVSNLILGVGPSILRRQAYYQDESPLSLVIELDNFDLLQRFIDHVGVNAIDVNGNSIIYLVVKHQKANLLRFLLTNYEVEIPEIIKPLQYDNVDRRYPQSIANKEMLWILINYGFPVNYYIPMDRKGRTVISNLLEADPNLALDEITELLNLDVPTFGLCNYTDRLDIWELIYSDVSLEGKQKRPNDNIDQDGFYIDDPIYVALHHGNLPPYSINQLIDCGLMYEEVLRTTRQEILNESYYAALAANTHYDPETKLEIAQLLAKHDASLYISEYTNVLLAIIPEFHNNNNSLLFKFLAAKVGLEQIDSVSGMNVVQLLQEYKGKVNLSDS